ncbi:hypothetical protein AQUSIP_19570 [Aquicella siphonis]|uniref:Peptidase C58 YopT-type domain-containing protein n=1 Tax=Aquicella siphonis TaxID=254247 RepID=A0A5E4PI70_9COXI|nr:hypothetical protein [Aquicella siphonis]VVC76634.1 hypothetical protein AQUSIP_19570 [Aquicella siphonis]
MQRMLPSTTYNLAGYSDYQFVTEFNGIWTPFSQTEAGYVGILTLFKTLQKKHHLPHLVTDAAACQGIALLYIENGCSMRGISTANPDRQTIHPSSLAKAVNYQARHSSTLAGRAAMTDPSGKIRCQLLSADAYPKQWNLEKMLARLNPSDGNIFFLTGYCEGWSQGRQYEGAHAFVIAHDGHVWKFFESQRGEAAFSRLEDLQAWIRKESASGTLREFNTSDPVEVRPGVTRRYSAYTLDAYSKDFTLDKSLTEPDYRGRETPDHPVYRAKL